MFLKLCRAILAGFSFSALCGILTLVVLSSHFYNPKLRVYSNASENIYDEAKGKVIAKSASPLPLPTLLGLSGEVEPIKSGGNDDLNYMPVTPIILKQHVSQTVNRSPINTLHDIIHGQESSAAVEGIYFSVKTTQKNHSIRLSILLLTWMQTVLPSQVHIVTDTIEPADDEWVNIAKKQGFSLYPTSCLPGHDPWNLCCKTGQEFDGYYRARTKGRQYKWFCHFDDDIYVNVPMLAATLETYDPLRNSIYIGRLPGKQQQQHVVRRPTISRLYPHYRRVEYQFAVGAGYCISDALMVQLEDYLRGVLFHSNCIEFKMVDTMLIGVIIESVLGYSLLHSSLFNSHYNLQNYSPTELKRQITISYILGKDKNIITLPNAAFTEEEDPTRLYSYHCHLYAQLEWCK